MSTEYHYIAQALIQGFVPLIDILPGNNKLVVDTSSISINEILNRLDLVTSSTDTVILINVDVWPAYKLDRIIVDNKKLKNKTVFITDLGYDNVQLSARCYRLSYPFWYFYRNLPKNKIFVPRAPNLKYKFGSLNNRPAPHRLLLGYHLMKRKLLDKIIFTQNNTSQQSYCPTKFYPSGEIDGFDVDIPAFEMLSKISDFNDYQKMLPILWNNQPIVNCHEVHHPAELETYSYILTEAMIEDLIWSNEIGSFTHMNLPIMSEKSWRPFASCQVPIFLAANGHLNYIESLGFIPFYDLYPPGFDQLTLEEKIAIIIDIVESYDIEDFYFRHLNELKHNHEVVFGDSVEKLVLSRIKEII